MGQLSGRSRHRKGHRKVMTAAVATSRRVVFLGAPYDLAPVDAG